MAENEGYKLYILVRRDMTPEQQAVQAGHAVAQFMMDTPNNTWKNRTLIYLSVKDSQSFALWESIVKKMYGRSKAVLSLGVFLDSEIYPDNPVTAMYMYGEACELLLRDLPLMRFK